MEESTVKDRIVKITKHFKLSQRAFSVKLGLSNNYVNKIHNEISTQALRNILREFPSVNVVWIITGEGEMLLPEDSVSSVFLKNKLDELISDNKKLQEKNEELIRQVGYLQGQVDLLTGNHSQATGA